eukprot:gene20871-25028_t
MQKFTANYSSSSRFGSSFGDSVALSSTHLVVGAPYDDVLGQNSGSVHFYNVADFGATFVQKVTAIDGSSFDRFGDSVALSSTHLVVGAQHRGDSYRGSVYVYNVTDSGATFVQKVRDGRSTGGDHFGRNVALSSTHLVVGTLQIVYLYSLFDSGVTLVQQITDARFCGNSVALLSTHLVVGCSGDDSSQGSVYLYSVTDSGATFMQKVTANDGSSYLFGNSVALSDTHLVVGERHGLGSESSGSVYVYSVNDSGATFLQKVTPNDGSSFDYFGNSIWNGPSVALSSTHLVVGAYGDDSYQGSVYVYSVSNSGATFVQKVTASDGNSNDYFGDSVALSSTHLVVGAPHRTSAMFGAVYLA